MIVSESNAQWSPDGTSLVMQLWLNEPDNPGVQPLIVMDVADGTEREAGNPSNDGFTSFAWSPDGRSIFSVDDAGTLEVIDAQAGTVRTEVGQSSSARCLAARPSLSGRMCPGGRAPARPPGLSSRHDRYRRPVRGDPRRRMGMRRHDRRRRRRADPPRRDRDDRRPRAASRPARPTPTDLVRRSFEFLLEREPKGSILAPLRPAADRPLLPRVRAHDPRLGRGAYDRGDVRAVRRPGRGAVQARRAVAARRAHGALRHRRLRLGCHAGWARTASCTSTATPGRSATTRRATRSAPRDARGPAPPPAARRA